MNGFWLGVLLGLAMVLGGALLGLLIADQLMGRALLHGAL